MLNEWEYLNKFLDDKVKEAAEVQCYIAQVIAYDGVFVDAKLVSESATELPTVISKVAICQSPYIKPMVMVGDFGLLLNVNNDIYSKILGANANFSGAASFVFLPLIQSSQMLSADPALLQISTPSKTNTIKFSETGTEVTSNNVKIESVGNIEATGSTVKLQSTSPISLGATDTLGPLLDELINIISTFESTPTAPGSPCTAGASTQAQLAILRTKVAGSFA